MDIPYDKRLHIIVGCAIFLFASTVFPVDISIGSVIVAGIGKEIYDYFHPNHTCDFWDALATFAGGAIGFLARYFLEY